MVMYDHDSAVPESPVSACGHHNEPRAHFCDVCGVKLSLRCPRCHATNRSQANFCSNCGIDLHIVPLIAPFGQAPGTSPATESELASARPDSIGPAKRAANEDWDGPEIVDLLPLAMQPGQALVADEFEDAERLKQLVQSFRRRQRRRRTWVLATGGATAVIAILGAAALVRTHIATPSVQGRSFVDKDAQASIPSRADVSKSATIAQNTPGNTGSLTLPRAGGELTFVVPGEPPSYDAHREETFALMHPAAPHYNTLLRIDPLDPTGTRVVEDLATSWTVSPDKRTYILKLRRGVKFHDGSEMTSRDVRASYQKIISPPPGITSVRKGEYLQIETVQAPEPYVVAFKLKWPSPSFIHSLASPWNWIYKADILERDVRWYEKNIMGTGPFVFVEHVKGSRWVGRRNPQYWDPGKPYLDGYQALFIRDDVAQASAIRTGRAHIQFRGFSPAQRDDLVGALGDKLTVQASPWNCVLLVAINHEKPPFHDPRVRRALSLALDRWTAAGALSKTAIVRDVAGVQVPGSPFATSPADLMKLAGYGRDIRESRSEARRLLAEAGVPEGFSLVLKNRDIPMPYHQIGEWLVDDWQRIGLTVHHEIQESAQYFRDLRAGNFELSTDFQCGYVVDPDLDLYKFQSKGRSDANYGRYTDPVLDDLYVRQSRTVDPEQRRRYIQAFEKRLDR